VCKCEAPAGRWTKSWRWEDGPARQEKADYASRAASALPVGGGHLGEEDLEGNGLKVRRMGVGYNTYITHPFFSFFNPPDRAGGNP